MKVEKLNQYPVRVPAKSAFAIETPPQELPLHQLLVSCAKRGGGKTSSLVSKMMDYQKQGLCDRIFVCSPTLGSNKAVLEQLQIADDDMFGNPTRESLIEIVRKIEIEGEEWREYLKKLENYKRLIKILKSKKPIENIDPEFLLRCLDDESLLEPPRSRYGHSPRLFIFLDDCMGTDVFSTSKNSPFISMCLRHRHLGGDGIGASIFMAIQSYTGQGSALPRCVRQNVTTLCLFKSKDKKSVDKIVEECCEDIDEAQFRECYAVATKEPFNFLCINFAATESKFRFRKNWDELLILPEPDEESVV